MRVCELAKSVKASSLEVLKQADALGIEAYSPLSQLDEKDVAKLQDVFNGRDAEAIAKERAASEEQRLAKHQAVMSRRAAQNKADKALLEANMSRAQEMDAHLKGHVPEQVTATPQPATGVASEPQVSQSGPAPVEAVATAEMASEPVAPATSEGPEGSSKAPEVDAERAEEKAVASHPAKSPAASNARFDIKEELEPEERLAGSFMHKIAKEPARESVKPPRQGLKDKDRDRDVTHVPQRHTHGKPSAQPMDPRQRHVKQPVRQEPTIAPDKIILLRGAVVVKDLAEKLGLRANRVIADLMQLNILASINQRVEIDVAQKIAEKYGFKIDIERAKRSTERKPILRSEDADDDIPEDKPEDLLPRPPVITFLGHVDHGKTSLMDRIRNTRVATGEAGGITQHIGAYTVELNGRKITFLDTPGHAAFSAMRARGASLTDIAVIIIAADDGIMPQTREAIKHAQQAGVQIMVAINKCDLPSAKPDRVRQMLQGEGLTPEEWGGDVICSEVSAVTGTGVDHLLEMILLQTDMLELSANQTRRADGFVVEAQLEQGLGPTATLLVTGGTLNVGDTILCGEHFGKIRGLIDDRGRRVKSATPATAVKCMGLSGVPEAGAPFRVMLNEKRARDLAERYSRDRKEIELVSSKATSLDALMTQMKENQRRELALIVKADTQGSSEAICEALKDVKSEKVTLNIIHEAIGNVSSTDVNKAAAGQALIVGFGVNCDAGVQQLARHEGVRINTFRIIYELMDFVKQRMLDLLSPEYKEVVKGHAEIRAIFDIGKMGRVAGCQMLDGQLRVDARCRIFRKKEQQWDGRFAALKHFQKDVTEVTGSQECGAFLEGYEAFQEGDILECYVLEELPRSL